jgi:hypothetical protein
LTELTASSLVREGRKWWALGVAILIGIAQFGVVALTFFFVAFGYAGRIRPT